MSNSLTVLYLKIVIPCDGSRNAFRMQDSLFHNGIPAFTIIMRIRIFTEEICEYDEMEMKQSFTIWIAIVWIEDVVQCIELEIMVQLEHDRIWRGENAQYVLTLRRHLCQHCIGQT